MWCEARWGAVSLSVLLLASCCIFIPGICNADDKKAEEEFPSEFDFRLISYDELVSSASVFTDSHIVGYTQLTLDGSRDQLLVGARDRLFRLSLDDLTLLEEADISAPDTTQSLCKKKGQPENFCYNYVRVLLLHNYTKTNSNSDVDHAVFMCGTNAYKPQCSWRPADNFSMVLETENGLARTPYNPFHNLTADNFSMVLETENGLARTPYNPFHNSTALITSEGDFYAATMIGPGDRDPAIYRSKGSKTTELRTIQSNSKWLNEPDFISTYEIGDFVYFFFREVAVEYINCGKKRYSRVARVCKTDEGSFFDKSWTTYYKSRLNCSLPGEYPFYYDELQSTYLLQDGADRFLYAVFTTAVNSIAGSAVCVYNMTSFNDSFTGPYKYQDNARAAWEKHDNPRPLTQCPVRRDTNKRSNEELIKNSMIELKYQLMDNAVQPTTESPFLFSSKERWSHVVVDNVRAKLGTYKVVFVATEAGKILKKTQLLGTNTTCLIEEIKIVPNGEPRPIKAMRISTDHMALYITTHHNIIKVPVERCSRFPNRDLCLAANDPYCGWSDDVNTKSCTTAPADQPEVHYWHQNMTVCPHVQHAVDGGWSSWSPWDVCDQVGGDPTAGGCQCRMRACDSPKPYYGGRPCTGASVEVTNCTTHGQWTEWSAWSTCTQSCGSTATHRRYRLCSNPPPRFGGRKCMGPDSEEDYCIGHPPCPLPPVQSNWTEWSDWTQCSAHCSGGVQSRRRKCNEPLPPVQSLPCLGDGIQWRTCNNHICEELNMMTPWTPWMAYNHTKGGRFEQRFRFLCRAKVPTQDSFMKATAMKPQSQFCVDGEHCHSSDNFTLTSVDGAWTDWSSWTGCSQRCDGGYRWRSRKCDDPPPFGEGKDCIGHPLEGQECNAHSCQGVWSCWTEMSTCSVSCGSGIQYRSRQCQSLPPGHSYTIPCTGNGEDIIPCDLGPCVNIAIAQSMSENDFEDLKFSLAQLFLVGGLCFVFGGCAAIALYAYVTSFRRAMRDAKKQERLQKLEKQLRQQKDLQRRISKTSMRHMPSMASQGSFEVFLSPKNRVYDVEGVTRDSMRSSMVDKDDYCSTLDRQCALRTFTVKDL